MICLLILWWVGVGAATSAGTLRVVPLGGPVTETVYALGAGDLVVGTDSSSVYPEAATKLPQIGYQRALAAEGILSLKPDLALATDEAGPANVLEQLRAAGVRLVLVPGEHTVAGAQAKVRGIAEALGRVEAGKKLAATIAKEAEDARVQIEKMTTRPTVLFLYARGSATFRNPLADPALLGVSSGAALGAVTSIVLAGRLAWTAPTWALPVCAFAGALGATAAVGLLGRVDGRTHLAGLLLAGIAVNAFGGAGVGLATFLANDAQLRSITFWSLGSLGAASWTVCGLLLPLLVLPGFLLLRQANLLNAMLLGETEAGHLGFRVETRKRVMLVSTALMVGASVSMVGIVGFVGLVAPHLLRLVLGPDHRLLLPASGLAGALLMLAADTACRTVAMPAEIPVGVATALLGAPFFLWLLWREQRASD